MSKGLAGLIFGLSSVFLLAMPAAAQLPSNSTVQGTYYFRYVGVDVTQNPFVPISAIGTVTFDGTTDKNGNGKTQITGTMLTRSGTADASSNLSYSGTYQVMSNSVISLFVPFGTVHNG